MARVRWKVKVKSGTGKWKKVEAEFDTDAESEQVSSELLQRLGMEVSPGSRRKYLEVEVLGEVLLWPFEVVENPGAFLRFGRGFIQTNGVIVSPSFKPPVRFAPGYPQPPVI